MHTLYINSDASQLNAGAVTGSEIRCREFQKKIFFDPQLLSLFHSVARMSVEVLESALEVGALLLLIKL